jgi:predicted nucleotidyltransferase
LTASDAPVPDRAAGVGTLAFGFRIVYLASATLELSDRQLARLAEIARRHRLELVVLFGSQARGRSHAGSDTDLAICRRDLPLDFDERLDLDAELGAALGRDVDLVDLRSADPLLLHQVFLAPRLLFGAPHAFERERLRAFHRYVDYRPFLALERAAVQAALQSHARRS